MDGRWPIGQGRRRRTIWKRECSSCICADIMLFGKNETHTWVYSFQCVNIIICRYGSEIPPDVLASRLSAYVHYFTLHGALRPFGCTALLAGYDASTQRHSLHMIEPSGSTFEYYAAAAGRGRQPARTEMEKLAVNPTRVAGGTGTTAGGGDDEGGQQLITVAEGVRQLAKIVYTIRDSGGSGSSKDGPFEIEMSWLCEKTGWKHVGVPKDVMDEAVEWAKREIEAEGEDDDDEEDDVDGGEGMEE